MAVKLWVLTWEGLPRSGVAQAKGGTDGKAQRRAAPMLRKGLERLHEIERVRYVLRLQRPGVLVLRDRSRDRKSAVPRPETGRDDIVRLRGERRVRA